MFDIYLGGAPATVIGEDKCTPGSEIMVAIIAHGRTRSKKTTTKFANLLLESVPNLVCVVWDLPNHGERTRDANLNKTWEEGNPLHAVVMQDIIDDAAIEAATILQYMPDYLSEFKVRARVIIGTSLGGYVAWKLASQNSKLISAAVPIISSPDVLKVMETRWEEFKASTKEPVNEELSFPDSLKGYMRGNARRCDELQKSSLPILAICGSDDPLVPPKYTQEWARNAGPNHRIELVPGVKHEVPREMIDLTIEYLIRLITHLDD